MNVPSNPTLASRATTLSSKGRGGNYFEDFRLNQVIRHGTPRTLTEGDASVYMALTGSRYAAHSAYTAAMQLGYASRPLDDLLVFNVAFGKTVPDISLNAVANLATPNCAFSPQCSAETRCAAKAL